MQRGNTKFNFVFLLWTALITVPAPAQSQFATDTPTIADPQDRSVVSSRLTSSPQFSGTVVDASGAAISAATVLVRSADGDAQKIMQTDRNGQFVIAGLPPDSYQLEISSEGFTGVEMPVTIVGTAALPPLRISLRVSVESVTVNVNGREDDLIGVADSGTQGTVGAEEIKDRPILRAGEILETIPGVIITQHAGGGKANQYFLRGFNLDHGTDFALFIDDMPLNLPSHAHGEGYSDMNTVIPELVKRVNYEKGPYNADVGNYGSAGSAHLEFFKKLSHNFAQVEGGMYGYGRLVFGASQKLGPGNLLYGGEAYHDDGPWTHPDNYYKFNGLLTYSRGSDTEGFSVTSRAYHGQWHSSDQIPVTAVPLVGFFGALNPTDGGRSQRYSLQGEWRRQGASSLTKIAAYGFYYDLNLFSDFTYYLNDPIKGDQFEQQDRRWVAGLDARHTVFSHWFGRRVENTIGLEIRNDWVHNGLFRTENRVRTDKADVLAPYPGEPNGYLPAATDLNKFTDTVGSFYAEAKIQWAEKFRSVLGFRGDDARYIVTSLTPAEQGTDFAAANSGSASKFLPQPKLSLIFGPWAGTEFYAQGGFGFHSNDARGATQKVQPISPDNPYPNTPSVPIPALVQTKGGEFGVRTAGVSHLQSTLSLWYLRSNSELQQDGDTGGTTASQQPSNRYGLEWANYYTPNGHLAFDLDMADSRAQFTQIDPDDAAFNNNGSICTSDHPLSCQPVQGPGGKLVPEAVKVVISSGITLHDYKAFSSSLRLRYFGPRDLTSDGLNRSNATLLLNAEAGYQIGEKWRVSVSVLNLLNRRNDDITYAYVSRLTPAGSAAFTNVIHPAEPLQVRFWLGRSF
jgi:hypothetical protein